MNKKVLVGVLCALMMLFAFTACEPQQMDWPYTGTDAKDVMGITLVNPDDVVLHAGEAFDTVYTGINIAYKDGTSDKNITAEISLSGNATTGQNKMSVKWGGEFDITGNVIVDAYEAESISLAIEDTTDLASAPTSGTLTITYGDGFVKEIPGYTSIEAGETENTVVAVLAAGSRTSVALKSAEVPYTLVAGPATPEYGDIRVFFSATQNGEEVDPDELWIGDSVYLTVKNYSTTTSDKFPVEDFDLVVNGVLLSESQKSAALSAKTLTAKTGDTYSVYIDGEEIATVTVPAGKNFMTTTDFDELFTPVATPATPGVTKISDALFTFDDADLEYKVALTDASCADGVEVVSVVNDGLAIPSDAKGTYPVTVNINVTVKGETTPDTVTVQVPVATAEPVEPEA